MQLQDVLADVAVIATNCQMDMEIGGICHDSRTAQRGDLFVAIAGFKQDGNKYITAARAAGALAVVCENVPSDDIPYIQVVNARVALAAVAANFCAHPARAMTMIGVTGTNGKTTVTYLLKEVLEARGAVVGLIGTNQNMIGDTPVYTERTTPEPNELQHLLRRMADAGCTHVVMEVSSHSLVLGRVYGIEFQLGIFTNVSQDHLDFHNTMEEYIAAKALLFAQCRHGVVNLDDDAACAVMAGGMCDFTTYSTRNNKADVTAENIHLKADGVMFEAVCKNQIARVELAIPGEFSVYNALAVVAAAHAIGVTLADAAHALKSAKGVKGRAEVVPTKTDYTVMIDYAHSPDGLQNILKTVRGFAAGRVIAVFGCGGDRDRLKRPIMGEVASRLSDITIVTSDNPRTEVPMAIISDILPGIVCDSAHFHVEPDRRAAIYYALDIAQAGDVIVLAGKGHETYQEINGIKNHLDEREIIAEYFLKK